MGSRRRGVTLLEVMIAASLLAIIILAAVSMLGTAQTLLNDNNMNAICLNAAQSRMEALLVSDWNQVLLPLYYRYLSKLNSYSFLAIPGLSGLDPSIVGVGAGELNTINHQPDGVIGNDGAIQTIVREPFRNEAPRYNFGDGNATGNELAPTTSNDYFPEQKITGLGPWPGGPTAVNIQPPFGPTLLCLVVRIKIPGMRGRPPISISLKTFRSWL